MKIEDQPSLDGVSLGQLSPMRQWVWMGSVGWQPTDLLANVAIRNLDE